MTHSFVVIGHVDHGKSTLSGHLLHLTGNVSDHELEIIRKSNNGKEVWSQLLDEYPEEREKSKTHEFALKTFSYLGNNYRLVDTPGHKIYIRSMISGLFQSVNTAVVIVSAKEFDSAFINGTLKEDLILARSAGIVNFIVCVNKCDMFDWDSTMIDGVISTVKTFIRGLGAKNIHFLATSGMLGHGIVENSPQSDMTNRGETLMSLLSKYPDLHYGSPILIEKSISQFCNNFTCKIKILQCDNIITSGFKCMLHYSENNSGSEVEVELSNICVSEKRPFSKIGDIMTCTIATAQNADISTKRLILRKDDYTIGFGQCL